jgi:myosin heavy subunit
MRRDRRPSKRLNGTQESADIELASTKPQALSGGARGAAVALERDAGADTTDLDLDKPVLEATADGKARQARETQETAAAEKKAAAAGKEMRAWAKAVRKDVRQAKADEAEVKKLQKQALKAERKKEELIQQELDRREREAQRLQSADQREAARQAQEAAEAAQLVRRIAKAETASAETVLAWMRPHIEVLINENPSCERVLGLLLLDCAEPKPAVLEVAATIQWLRTMPTQKRPSTRPRSIKKRIAASCRTCAPTHARRFVRR